MRHLLLALAVLVGMLAVPGQPPLAAQVPVPSASGGPIALTVAELQALAARAPADSPTPPIVPLRDGPRRRARLAPAARAGTLPHRASLSGLFTAALGLPAIDAGTANSLVPDPALGAGPEQILLAVNGRVRAFERQTGAIGALDLTLQQFFVAVRNGKSLGGPRVRFDPFRQRWLVATTTIEVPNRLLLAVSQGATITPSTVWHFYALKQAEVEPAGDRFCLVADLSLGLDTRAVYLAGNLFCGPTVAELTFGGSAAYVIAAASLNGGPVRATALRRLMDLETGTGLYAPLAADNFEANPSAGYLIGVDGGSFGRLVVQRIAAPDVLPTLGPQQTLVVPPTALPRTVPHRGNNNGTFGELSAGDDRLTSAVIRDGWLWTVQTIGVDTNGQASSEPDRRNALRWYQLAALDGFPVVEQWGTVFDSAPEDPLHFWLPALGVNGLGQLALVFDLAGAAHYVDAAQAARAPADPAGVMRPIQPLSASAVAYNPLGDVGGRFGRRWGTYSALALDACDQASFWAAVPYVATSEAWGVWLSRLVPPPPPPLRGAVPAYLPIGEPALVVQLAGEQLPDAQYYAGTAVCPLQTVFDRGVRVQAVERVGPADLRLIVDTTAATAGPLTITIRNPDGQSVSVSGLLRAGPPLTAAGFLPLSGR